MWSDRYYYLNICSDLELEEQTSKRDGMESFEVSGNVVDQLAEAVVTESLKDSEFADYSRLELFE